MKDEKAKVKAILFDLDGTIFSARAIGVLTGLSSKGDMEKASISTISNLSQLSKIIDESA